MTLPEPLFLILDTDVLVDILRNKSEALAWLDSLRLQPSIVGYAAMEALYGCKDKKELRSVERFLQNFAILWPTEAGLVRAMKEYMPLTLAHRIGVIDALVATTAIEYDMTLATFNIKHFRAVSSLKTVQPYER